MTAEPESRPSASVALLDRAVIVLNAIGSLWVLFLVLVICLDSFGRSFFNRPFDGVNEVVAVSMAFIVFCQLPDTVRIGRLTRSDSFLPRLQASHWLPARMTVTGFDVLGAIVMITILIGTFPRLIESIERGYYIGEQGIFTFPDWPMKGMVVLGSFAALLCFLVRAVVHWCASSPHRD